jgi:hypothetical protein
LKKSYTLTIEVMDDNLATSEATVAVYVRDMNDLTVTGFVGSPFSTDGSGLITLVGTNMGPFTEALRPGIPYVIFFQGTLSHMSFSAGSVTATYGNAFNSYTAPSCNVSSRNTEVTCTTVPGVGNNLRFSLTVYPWNVVTTVTASYTPPSISSLAGLVDVPTIGGTELVIMGNNFGPLGYVPVVMYTHVATNSTFSAVNCSVSVAHVSITCLTGPGAGVGLEVSVVIGGQASNALLVATGYSGPTLSGVAPMLYLAAGYEGITLQGGNFGPAGLGVVIAVRYGPASDRQKYSAQSCVRDAASPHSVVVCAAAPGVGTGLMFLVEVNGQQSQLLPTAVAYRAPKVQSVRSVSANGNAIGCQFSVLCPNLICVLAIKGTNFGPETAVDDPILSAVIFFRHD